MAKKIKHIKTGRFLGPATLRRCNTTNRRFKTNLRLRGKLYESFNEIQIESWYSHYRDLDGFMQKFSWEDFEIVIC